MGNVFVGGAPVCDDSWDLADATVVCRELGFYKAKQAFTESKFGNVSSNFRMDNVKCLGTEQKLVQCRHSEQDDCGGSEGAGVECDTRNYSAIVNSECFDLDISYTFGDYIDQMNGINSTEACQKHCQASNECSHFSYYPDISRCYRKSGNTKTFKSGAISGPKYCSNATAPVVETNTCFEYGVGYNYGHYSNYFTAEDEGRCQKRCQDYPGCMYFSYYKSNSECYMKTGNTNRRRHSDVVSGPKFCPGASNNTSSSNSSNSCFTPGEVCLLGGAGSFEGNVYYSGKPVCDDNWDSRDGDVVCRQLGFHALVRVTKQSMFGTVSTDFGMDNVACSGSELKLDECEYNRIDDCGAREGAGVICDKRSKNEIDQEKEYIQHCFDEGVAYNFGDFVDFDVSHSALACQKHCLNHQDCSHFTFYPESGKCYRKTGNTKQTMDGAISGPRNCSDPNYTANPQPSYTTPTPCSSPGAICLTGGGSRGDILIEDRPVCDDDWTLVNAHVACKQLGFIGALAFTKESRFGSSSRDFIMDSVRCDGTEERLIDCQHNTDHDCREGEAAGVLCDTRSKKEELDIESTCFSSNVSYSPGSFIDYDIVASPYDCQKLCASHSECTYFTFYTDTNKCYRKTTNLALPKRGAISGPRQCPGNGTNITTSTLPPRDCNLPGVVCLKQGSSPNEGNVYIGGKPVCDDHWDARDGRVVCRELGFKDMLTTYVRSHFGMVSRNFAMDNVECTGTEQRLRMCHHSKSDDCDRNEGAGVTCDNDEPIEIPEPCRAAGKVCLLGGKDASEGNVYIEGKPVCDDGWSFADAHVTCISLGYQEAERVMKESAFGLVPSNFGASGVECIGNELGIDACVKMKTNINCNRREGAGVKCVGGVGAAADGQQSSGSIATAVILVLIVGVTGLLVYVYRTKLGHLMSREVLVRLSGNNPLIR